MIGPTSVITCLSAQKIQQGKESNTDKIHKTCANQQIHHKPIALWGLSGLLQILEFFFFLQEYKMFLDSRCSYYFVFRYISRPKILQVREDTSEVDLFLLSVFCFLLPTVLVGIQIHTNIFVVNTITTMLMI